MAREMTEFVDELDEVFGATMLTAHDLVMPHHSKTDPALDGFKANFVALYLLVQELREDPPVEARLVSPAQARVMLGVGKKDIEAMMADGDLPWVDIAGRQRIPIEAIDEMCEMLDDEEEPCE